MHNRSLHTLLLLTKSVATQTPISDLVGYIMQDLRSMVAHLRGTDLAVAGHAVALAGWHQVRLSSQPDSHSTSAYSFGRVAVVALVAKLTHPRYQRRCAA